MPFDVSSAGRCIVLDNLPPVVRLSWSDGVLTLASEPSDHQDVDSLEEKHDLDRLHAFLTERIKELEADQTALKAGIAYRDSRIRELQVGQENFLKLWNDRTEEIVQEKDARIQSLHDELQSLTAKYESLVKAHYALASRYNDLIPSTPVEASDVEEPPAELPTVPPVVGHRFRMRDGSEVEVVSQDSHERYPFNGSNGLSWTLTGSEFSNRSSDCDLVEDLGPVDSDDDDDDADSEDDSDVDDASDGCAGCGKPLDAQDTCPSCTTPSQFQITSPGWYVMRNGRKVELRHRLDSDASRPFPSAANYDYRWFAVDADRDFPRDTCGWPTDAVVRREPTWTPSGQWVSETTVEYEYDVVSGPLAEGLVNVAPEAIPQEPRHPKPLSSPITGPGQYRTRDGNVVTIVERNDSVTELIHEWYGRIAAESHGRLLKARTWHSDGWFGTVGSPYPLDLVARLPDPVPEPVRTFPSWLHPKYRYVARDQDGRWFAYGTEPNLCVSADQWTSSGSILPLSPNDYAPEALPSIVPDVDWKLSLIPRELS